MTGAGPTTPAIETMNVPGDPRLALDACGTGALVVFLHGIGGDRSHWRDQLPVFGRRFRAIAWDARGYGDSGDYDGPLATEDFSRDLARVLDHLGAAKAHLVGLSMGGRIALDFYALFPGRVASLVLCDTHAAFLNLAQVDQNRFRERHRLIESGVATPADLAMEGVDRLLAPNASAAVRKRVADAMAAQRPRSYVKVLAAILVFNRSAVLAKIRVPTLLVVGKHDPLTPPSLMRAMAERIAGAKLEIIEGAGHVSNVEQPEAFNQIVLSFLSALPGP